MHPLPCLVIPVDHNPLDPLMGAEHRNVSKDRSKQVDLHEFNLICYR